MQTIHQEAEQYYDSDQIYLVGDSTSDYDLSVSFSRDNVMISVLSVDFCDFWSCCLLSNRWACLCCSF